VPLAESHRFVGEGIDLFCEMRDMLFMILLPMDFLEAIEHPLQQPQFTFELTKQANLTIELDGWIEKYN